MISAYASTLIYAQQLHRTFDSAGPLPSPQFLTRSYCQQPEVRLQFAVLEDALHVFQTTYEMTHKRGQRLHQETRDWLLSPRETYLFDCRAIVLVLGIDPDWFQTGVRAWSDRRITQKVTTRPYRNHMRMPRKIASVAA